MPSGETDASTAPFGPEATRDAILRTAGEVFLAHGYERSSMDQIASQSGVARQTLYNHFPHKRALFDVAISRLWEQMPLSPVIAATSGSQSPKEVLYGIGLAIADFWSRPDAIAIVRLMIWDGPRLYEMGPNFLNGDTEPARDAVKRYVRRLSRRQDFRISDPDLAATQFVDVILGEVVHGQLTLSRRETIEESRRDYVVGGAVALFLARYHVPMAHQVSELRVGGAGERS